MHKNATRGAYADSLKVYLQEKPLRDIYLYSFKLLVKNS